MYLSADDLVHYLIHRGFVTSNEVVEGNVTVMEATRRNRNFKVLRQSNPGLFIKQARHWDTRATETVQREALCYSLSRSVPELACLGEMLPAFHHFDPQYHLLVFELLSGYESLAEHQQKTGKFPPEIAVMLGEILANYHRSTKDTVAKALEPRVFPRAVPWVLSFHLQQPDWFHSISAGNSQLLRIVKDYEQFATTLDELRSRWEHSTLIHGDLKWDNCLIKSQDDGSASTLLRVVDWEMADLGDPLWDVGAILQSYLSYWILSMPISEGSSPDEFIARAPSALEDFQAPMKALWRRYQEVMEVPQDRQAQALLRSVQYGAARMIQTAFESLTYSPTVNQNALYLLQVSMNVLKDPEEAARELFGIAEA
jgi:5-methylthioribose kinase